MYRLARWLGWSVLLSLTPYIGLVVLRFLDVQHWPGLVPLFGSGQLLLTSVALLAAGVREMSVMSAETRTRTRDFLLLASFVFTVLLSMTYGYLANEVIAARSQSSEDESLVTSLSFAFFAASLVTAGGAVAVSAPQEAQNV